MGSATPSLSRSVAAPEADPDSALPIYSVWVPLLTPIYAPWRAGPLHRAGEVVRAKNPRYDLQYY